MKIQNLLYVTLVVAVLSLFSVTPVFANEGMHCPHTEHTIQSLRNCVAHAAEMRHIENRGVTNSLLAKLDAARAAADRGQNHVAVAKVEAFIHEVEAQAGKHIDTTHANHMIMHAQHVIHSLGH